MVAFVWITILTSVVFALDVEAKCYQEYKKILKPFINHSCSLDKMVGRWSDVWGSPWTRDVYNIKCAYTDFFDNATVISTALMKSPEVNDLAFSIKKIDQKVLDFQEDVLLLKDEDAKDVIAEIYPLYCSKDVFGYFICETGRTLHRSWDVQITVRTDKLDDPEAQEEVKDAKQHMMKLDKYGVYDGTDYEHVC